MSLHKNIVLASPKHAMSMEIKQMCTKSNYRMEAEAQRYHLTSPRMFV